MRFYSIFLVAAACGSEGSSTVDAPAPNDTPVDTAVDGAPPLPRAGGVEVTELATPDGAISGAGARFVAGSTWGTPSGSNGLCLAFENPSGELSAGTISITGTTSPVTIEPTGSAPDVRYRENTVPPDDLFAPGATIMATAAGGPDFEGFSTSAVAPAPVAGYTAPTTLNRTNGTTLSWTAGAGPKILVALFGGTQQGVRIVLCRVDDTGSYTLTAGDLALLPSAAITNDQALLAVGRFVEVTTTTPSGAVTFSLLSAIRSEVALSQ